MKTNSVLLAGILTLLGASAFAQTTPADAVKQDNAQIRSDNGQIRHQNRDIRRDTTAVGKDGRAIASDQRAIKADRVKQNADQRLENADIKKGDLADAQTANQARTQEQHAINGKKRNIHKERSAIAHARNDRHGDKVVRNQELHARNADVAKRNKDAAHIN